MYLFRKSCYVWEKRYHDLKKKKDYVYVILSYCLIICFLSQYFFIGARFVKFVVNSIDFFQGFPQGFFLRILDDSVLFRFFSDKVFPKVLNLWYVSPILKIYFLKFDIFSFGCPGCCSENVPSILNLHEGNRPITFHVLKCWIILKKNQFNEWNLSSEFLLFYFITTERWLEKKKWRRRWNEINVELFMVEWEKQCCCDISWIWLDKLLVWVNWEYYSNYCIFKIKNEDCCMISMLIKSELWLQILVCVGLVLSF